VVVTGLVGVGVALILAAIKPKVTLTHSLSRFTAESAKRIFAAAAAAPSGAFTMLVDRPFRWPPITNSGWSFGPFPESIPGNGDLV
jgi:hypothetical protein